MLWFNATTSEVIDIASRNNLKNKVKEYPLPSWFGIQEQIIHYHKFQHEKMTTPDSIYIIMNFKQIDNESVFIFTLPIKLVNNLMESQIVGPIILPKCMHKKKGKRHEPRNKKTTYLQKNNALHT